MIKQEIKEENDTEDEMNPLEDPLIVKTECEDIIESGDMSIKLELEAESIDHIEKVKNTKT